MFGKVELDGVVYNKIGEMKVNNRVYVLTINSSELSFLEASTVDGETKYSKPNLVFSLAANAGTSLTRLNERIVVNHITKELKDMIKAGKITNQQQLNEAITLRQNVLTNNQELRRLLRGNVNDLTEEKFANDSKALIAFFDEKLIPKKPKVDDFEIVDVANDSDAVDRTILNQEIYNQIKKQEAMAKIAPQEVPVAVPESKEPVSINNGIIEPAVIETKIEEPTLEVAPVSTNVSIEDTVEQPRHSDNPFPVSDKELAPLADKMLAEHKEELSPDQVTHLEEIQQQEVAKEVKAEENVMTNDKQLVLTKPSKKAAYVDTVILCLISQLGIFALLIFVLLLIK